MSATLKQRREVTRIVLNGIKVLSGEMPYETFSNAPVASPDEKPPEKPAHVETRILTSVRVVKTTNGITVSSPFNRKFVKSANALDGKFDGGLWIFDNRLESDVRQILNEVYGSDGQSEGEFVRFRIEWKDREFASTAPIEVAGRSIARAFGRDSGAKSGDGVIVRAGGFSSGGSMKNWGTIVKSETIVELLDFPRAKAEKLVNSQPDEDRVYSIVGDTANESLDSAVTAEWMTADDEYDAEFGEYFSD